MKFWKAIIAFCLVLISLALVSSSGLEEAVDKAIAEIGRLNPEHQVFLEELGKMLQQHLKSSNACTFIETADCAVEFLLSAFELYEMPENLELETFCLINASIYRYYAGEDSPLTAKLDTFYRISRPKLEASAAFRLIFCPIYEVAAKSIAEDPDSLEKTLVKRLCRWYEINLKQGSKKEKRSFAKICNFLTEHIFKIPKEQTEIWVDEEKESSAGKRTPFPVETEASPKRARTDDASLSAEPESTENSESKTESDFNEDSNEDAEYAEKDDDAGAELFNDPRPFLRILNLNHTPLRTASLNSLISLFEDEIDKDFAASPVEVRVGVVDIYLKYLHQVMSANK